MSSGWAVVLLRKPCVNSILSSYFDAIFAGTSGGVHADVLVAYYSVCVFAFFLSSFEPSSRNY